MALIIVAWIHKFGCDADARYQANFLPFLCSFAHAGGQNFAERVLEVKVTLSYGKPSNKTWKVKGSDVNILFANLNKNGFWGRYTSNVSVSWSGKGSKFDTIKFTAKPVITMPSWIDYSKVKAGQKSWDKMWKALKKHEDNHHLIFDTAAKAFKKRLEAGGDLDKKDMEKAWGAFEKDTQKLQDDYDKKSKHGKNEGVSLDAW